MPNDFSQLEKTMAAMLADLSPSIRKKITMGLSAKLRNVNAQNIAKNLEPDGAKMAPRRILKENFKTRAGKTRAKLLMFKKLSKLRYLKKKATPESAEIGFYGGSVSRIAKAHHYGLEDRIVRSKPRKVKYIQRRLLGINSEIENAAMDAATAFFPELK